TTDMYDPSLLHAQTTKVKIKIVYLCDSETDNAVIYLDDVSFMKK
ncbi:unnamed protein product, partial [marine sediment metagenome]